MTLVFSKNKSEMVEDLRKLTPEEISFINKCLMLVALEKFHSHVMKDSGDLE